MVNSTNTAGSSADFSHTPWDGSHPAFRIGLAPLGDRTWIEMGGRGSAQLDEKKRLLAEMRDDVFMAKPESLPAQVEVLDLVLGELTHRHGGTHRREDNVVTVGDISVDLEDDAMPPLEKASRLVPEDLVIMMPGENGWYLGAGCVCFPSNWVLAEKFGKPMQEVHGGVPQFGPGTRNAMMITRIFDNLQTDIPVIRMNWSIHEDDELYHGIGKLSLAERTFEQPYLRVEVQTLHKMAETGAILFTIRTHVDPLTLLESHRDRRRLAHGLAESLARLDTAQCRYKGIVNARERLIARLGAIAGEADQAYKTP